MKRLELRNENFECKLFALVDWNLVIKKISEELGVTIDDKTLKLCISLCEHDVNPEALALVVYNLKKLYNLWVVFVFLLKFYFFV